MTTPATRAELVEVMARALAKANQMNIVTAPVRSDAEAILAAMEAHGCVVVSEQDANNLLLWASDIEFFGDTGKPIPSHFRKEQVE